MQDRSMISVRDLVIEYRDGKRAVDHISFEVESGECVGFIGLNGAGKSSTIKALLGFHFPTEGTIKIFGLDPNDSRSRYRIGYLPEVALYYPFLKAREILELYGGLQGLNKTDLKKRIPVLLDELGLAGRGETLIREFSKGMQQRIGIAQAIIAEPELMIFDELTSGLDPLGRHELHQILLRYKEQGKTLFFSSHDLDDVEHLCDRVIIIHKGRIIHQATIGNLLQPLNQFEIVFEGGDKNKIPEHLAKNATADANIANRYTIKMHSAPDFADTVSALNAGGARLIKSGSRTTSLEDEFIRLINDYEAKQTDQKQ